MFLYKLKKNGQQPHILMQQHWKFLEIQNGLKEEIFEELKQFI